jgi:hypothetical protein
MALRLFVLNPVTIFAARVNMATITYPLDHVTFDGVTTGAFGDIVPGMTVLFGSTAGADDLGRQRVRAAATSTVLPIGRSSKGAHDGEVNLADNVFITVLNDYRVWAKMPFINPDGDIFKDSDLSYTDQTVESPPVANCGPGTAVTASAGAAEVAFDGSASFATADGATISSYAWNLADGNVTAGASNTAFVTAEFSPGFRWVALTVQDSNGKVHTARCPIYVRDADDDDTIEHFEITSHRISQTGQELEFETGSTITAPDGTLVMIFDGEPVTNGDRTHMLFIGWHQEDPADLNATKTGYLRDTRMRCVDVAGRLQVLPAFPQSIETAAVPDKWTEMVAPNMDKYLHYLLYWHSTALELADWSWSGTEGYYPFVVLGSDGDSLFGQVNRRAQALVPDHLLTCDTIGRLRTLPDPMLQATGDRTATVQVTLDEGDWSTIRYTHQRPPRVHWLRSNAILASTAEPIEALFSIAPGNGPSQGESAQTEGEHLAASQDDLNDAEGHRYARINAPEGKFSIGLVAGDDLDIEPADMTWVQLTIGATYAAQRGLTFTNARGLVHDISIRYSYSRTGLIREVDLTWEREVTGHAAEIDPQHISDALPPPDFEPPPPDNYVVDPGPPPISTTGQGTVYVRDENGLYRTRDLSPASPTWASIGPTVGGSEHYEDFILDPWFPDTIGYLATSEGLYMSDDLDQVTPTWTLMVSDATDVSGATGVTISSLTSQKVLGSPNVDGFCAWFFHVAPTGSEIWMCRTYDRWATFDFVKAIDGGASADFLAAGAVDIVPHLVGGELVFYIATKLSDKLYKSEDSGDTWSIVGTFPDDISEPRVVHIPFDDNDAGDIVYCAFETDGTTSPVGRVYRTTDGGGAFTTISPIASRGVGFHRTAIESSLLNRLDMYCWVEQQPALGDANGRTKLYVTDDGGATWTFMYQVATSTVVASSGFPYIGGQFYAVTADDVLLSVDGGTTFVSKKGDVFTAVGAGNFDVSSKCTIVALWTE